MLVWRKGPHIHGADQSLFCQLLIYKHILCTLQVQISREEPGSPTFRWPVLSVYCQLVTCWSFIMGLSLTFMLLVANLATQHNAKKQLINDRNDSIWVVIWEYSARAIQWIPILQGLDSFQNFLYPCALDESSLSLERVKPFSCWGHFLPIYKNAKYYENHLNQVMWVFIGKLLLSIVIWVPIC